MFTRNNATLVSEEMVPSINTGHFFQNQAKLTWLDNGISVVSYGCKICFAQFNSQQATGIHIGKMHNTKPANPNAYATNPIKAIEKIIEDRDYWRKRAKTMERKLRALGSVLNIED